MKVKRLLSRALKRNILSIIILPHYLIQKYIYRKPIIIRWNSSDVNVYYHTLIQKEYDFPFTINPANIIDAGANIGLSSVLLKKKYPSARVICIEPESGNFELLKRNTSGFEDVYLHQNGLWSKSAYLNIINPNQSNWAFITQETDDENNYDVHSVSIKDIMNQYEIDTIDILKVDIEGSEMELFSRNAHEWLGATKLIIIEIHSPPYRKICERKLSEFGFDHIHSRGENDYYAQSSYYDPNTKIFS